MAITQKNDSTLVFCEPTNSGTLETLSLEILGLGKALSRSRGQELSVVAVQDISLEAAACGADQVYIAQINSKIGDASEWIVALLEQACQTCNPEAVILPHSPLGQDIAPRLALRLGTWFVSDVVDIAIRDNRIVVQKPLYGGLAFATYAFNTSPNIFTVRRGVGNLPERDESHTAITHEIQVAPQQASAQWELVERVREDNADIKLEDAKIIVSGGRGIGGAEGFELLRKLATELGAAVGSSRPPCDAGWISSSHQVGITGAVVSPDLYIAIGISGTSQHLSGMTDSKKIVTINKDPDADIFQVSDYGAVCDYRQALPAFIDTIRENRENK